MSKLNVDEISDVANTGPVTITDGLIVSSGGIVSSGSAVLTSASTANFPAGSVLQVVSAFKNDTFSAASGSYVDITGLSVSITPSSASNKIFIVVSVGTLGVSTDAAFTARLLRGATVIAQPDVGTGDLKDGAFNFYNGSSAGITIGASISYLDSPATTSSTTYKVSGYCNAGTFYINRLAGDSTWQSTSSITVMEIAV